MQKELIEPKAEVVTVVKIQHPYYYFSDERIPYEGQKLKSNQFLAVTRDGKEEMYCGEKATEMLLNTLIDQGVCRNTKRAIGWLNEMNRSFNDLNVGKFARDSVLCDMCAKRIGVKKCSGCCNASIPTRYCSRECQVAAWPLHKKTCHGHAKA